MIRTRALPELPILLIAVVVRFRDANILIHFALAVTTRRCPWQGWRVRHTRHTSGTIASFERLHLTTRDPIKGVQGRLPPK
jgi:hypothetical protein